ncbi:hypothetical protein F5B22DRAFT_596925 [Xylaria bambusicola]|uniref:uncharacterized protein n=1 Tax=Xylaria bambusicola TaxID=326684 RepID=UPI0020075BC4|nr:uncharacterized protein F5B22DRAFT_596925 [Xylaria bambusicola]KAI0520944.1 hypothetical protein F5B22DRAFT_596925 [Xylaria bambusicola]
MSYRIEISPNNRAGCQDKVCKDSKHKITKGELRFGVWFVVPTIEKGSWKWRHWGCVSGKSIENLQNAIKQDDGSYDWNMLDGYDEIEDSDLQEKIQRVVTQGHIDPEDFNGDPDFNVPGKTAIRGRAKKAKAGSDDEAGEDATTPKKAAPKKTAGAKRGRKKAQEEDEEEEAEEEPEPVKKKAKSSRKAKKVEEEEEEEVKPVKKARGRKAKTDDAAEKDNDEVAKPVKKGKAGRNSTKQPVKEEEEQEEEEPEEPEEPVPAKKSRGRKAAKKEPSPPPAPEDDDEPDDDEPITKAVAKGKVGRKAKAAATAPKGGKRRSTKA